MADENRTSDRPLADRLIPRARRFSFFQLVRLLEQCAGGSARVGYGGPASSEIIRFRPDTSLSFPVSDITELDLVESPGTKDNRYRITSTFLAMKDLKALI